MNRDQRDKQESYSPGDAHFHYSREERYRYLSPEITDRTKKRGIFRGNRGLIILLVDILLILLLYFILNPLLQGRASSTDFMGYEVHFSAFSYEDEVFMSLRFLTKETDSSAVPSEGPLVRVAFSLAGSDDVVELTDLLPVQAGSERIIRTRMAPQGKPESAAAVVSIGDRSITLKTDIRPEQE